MEVHASDWTQGGWWVNLDSGERKWMSDKEINANWEPL